MSILNEFPSFLQKIDNNINNLNLLLSTPSYSSSPISPNISKLLKETNELISSSNSFLSSLLNSQNSSTFQNDLFFNQKLEKYYKDLISRKKQVSLLTRQFQEKLLGISKSYNNNNKIIISNEDDNYNENDKLLNNKPVELEFLTDYNERLLGDSIKNITKTNKNIEETIKNEKEQGNKLNEIYYKAEDNEAKTKIGRDYINSITCQEKCKRISLMTLNIILFLTIILMIIYKLI